MQTHAERSRTIKMVSHASRMIMGLTFITSGFVKVIDPWGTYIKVDEYLMIYGWEALMPLSMYFSVWLCSAELMMGCMLTFKVRIRFVSIFALLSMTIFTIITLLSATIIPVEDCGCFGDALKLTAWQTFFKNLALLPMAFVVWWRYRPDKIFLFKRIELMLAALFFSMSLGLGVYCYRHLPLIDYLPYKVGVNLPQAIKDAEKLHSQSFETVLIYKNINNGELREFQITDPTWQDERTWEWVDTVTKDDESDIRPLISEFSLRDRDGLTATDEVLATSGILNILFVTQFNDIDEECLNSFNKIIREGDVRGEKTICITPDHIVDNLFIHDIECYNIDPTTMKTALRAKEGLMRLHDGVIVKKRNCRDL
ncbi:MAG: DoxX protein [Rikenellaceae bacterium]